MNCHVYIASGDGLYTVGFYNPSGAWIAESDHTTTQKAAARAHYLNGGKDGVAALLEAVRNERAARERYFTETKGKDANAALWKASRAAVAKALEVFQ